MHRFVEIGLALSLLYAAVGFVFAVAFQIRGLGVVDPAARHAGWFFRALITPGTMALWPLLIRRWQVALQSSGKPTEASVFISPEALGRLHQRAWWVILLSAPIILGIALIFRPSEPIQSKLPTVLGAADRR